jgi:UDP-GlcNAc:undecaprenyl-phosphate GlcNAc-1-phosphate transferase
MEMLYGFVVAMTVTMALIPLLIRIAQRAHIVDLPGPRKVHASPIPRVGGIAMAVGVLLALLLWGHFDHMMESFCAGVLILLVFGVWDDRVTLGPGAKFLGQALAAVIAMLWGGVSIASITLADRLMLPGWIAAPLTFLFLVGATNAINLSDGLDGLAGGMALLCLGALALLALTVGNLAVGLVALVVAGAILGFLRFNTHPARVFMGDCGSQILGFSVAVLSVQLTQDPQVPLSSALPLLLLGVPIIDTLMVMTERILAGRSPFKADRNHIHHRLLALGLGHHEAVMAIYVVQSMLFVLAWWMRYQPDAVNLAVFLGFAAALVGLLHLAAQRHRQHAARPAVARPASGRWKALSQLPRWAAWSMGAALLVYAMAVWWLVATPAPDSQLIAALIAAVLGISLALRWRQTTAGWFDKSALYLTAVLIVYLDDYDGLHGQLLHLTEWILFPLIAASAVILLRAPHQRWLSVNPLDILIIFLAVAIPNLPGSIVSPRAVAAIVAKLVLLLYGIEGFMIAIDRHWRWFSAAALAFLLLCIVRA